MIKYFGEECVDWFIKEMLQEETYLSNYFENDIR